MTFDFETLLRHAEKKIAELSARDFLPRELVRLVGDTHLRQVRALAEVRLDLPAPGDLTPADQNLLGKPLLAPERFPLDRTQARSLFREFLATLAATGDQAGASAARIATDLDSGALDLDQAFDGFLARGGESLDPWSARTPDTPRAMHYLVLSALGPSLATVGRALAEGLGDSTRQQGACPVCGGAALMAELGGKEGQRLLTCSFCRARYRVRRLACVHCDTDDTARLAYFDSEDAPGFRLDVCDGCGHYLKTIDFRDMDRVAVPELDDLASLPLDLLARERGYARVSLSAWGF
jgi:FdhE protein